MEVNMSLVGKPVMHLWGGAVRYGFVQSEEMKDKWKHCTINWVNDEVYTKNMKDLANLRSGEDHTRHIYRVDELLFINIDKQLQDLREVKKKIKS